MPDGGNGAAAMSAQANGGLHPPDDVFWSVETGGMRLYRPDRGWTEFLEYPRAAVWELIVRRGRTSGLAQKIGHIGDLDPAQAERLVAECVEEWQRNGLLTAG